jgi:GNAT superfamily N-acetyltransferase
MVLGSFTNEKGYNIVVNLIKPEEAPGEITIFFLNKWADLIKAGHASESYFPSLRPLASRILYVTVNGEMAGHIVFDWTTPFECFIMLTAVEPKFRRHGLYKLMHQYYDGHIKSQGAKRSKSQLHVSNEAIIAAAEQDGYRKEYYRMIKEY